MPAKPGSWYHDGNAAPDGADTALIPDIGHSLGHVPKFGGLLYFVSVAGDNANDGLDPDESFLTIQHAIDTAAVGDAITIMAGAYDEAVTLNKNYMELWCEIGAILANTTPGTPLIVSASYCRIRGLVVEQAGEVGIQVTGAHCEFQDCTSRTGTVAWDVDGVANRFSDCLAGAYTTTGWDIGANGNKIHRCSATGTGATRGFYGRTGLRCFFEQCYSNNNATAGWETTTVFTDATFMNCSTSVTDGRRVDGGYNNTWPGFSNTPRRAHHEHVYPAAAGEGIASDPIVVTNIMTDDSGAGPWSDQDYWGDVVRLIPPETLTVSWSCLGLYIDALTALDRQPWEILFTNYHYQSARNAGNAWSYQETILTVADGAMFAVGDKVWISGTGALDGEICNVVDVTGDVVTITSETRISADTGLKYNYGGAEMMYVVRRETDRTLHGYDGTHMAASAKSFSRYVWHEAKSIEPDGAMIMRVANATDAADSSFAVRAIYVD